MELERYQARATTITERIGSNPMAMEAITSTILKWNEAGDVLKLNRINPYAVQAESNVPVNELVPEFLYGVQQELFDMHWDAHCPHCNGVSDESSSLNDTTGVTHCKMCDVEFETDISSRVEVTFSLARDILDLNLPPLCETPASLNPRNAVSGIAPGETKEGVEIMPQGEYRYFCPITNSRGVLNVDGAPTEEIQVFKINQEGDDFDVLTKTLQPGPIKFVVNNKGTLPAGLVITKNELGPELSEKDYARRLTGLEVLHYPSFKEHFGDQAPSDRERLKIQSVTTLFTDIVGSTKMYETLGDTKAYNMVRDHFDILFEEIEKQGGAVIKTIGDSVMASFTSNESALESLMALRERMNDYNADKPQDSRINIRSGIHRGPAILVNLNGRLDYFGTAINKAARVESISRGQEVSLSEEVYQDVLPVLKRHGIREIRRRQVNFKGLEGEQSVYSFHMDGRALRVTA